jgi:AcrR family transcriptional regulator
MVKTRNVVKGLHLGHHGGVTQTTGTPDAATPTTAPTRRERMREATVREILDAARAQLRTSGPQGLTLSAVAREVGMTAPGLYRYVDGVDGLLTLLISEGFSGLAAELEAARDTRPRDDPGGRFLALALALRAWARADTAQYGLLFGTPLPGYAAPQEGPTTDGARRAAGALWQVVVDARDDGLLGPPLVDAVDPLAEALLAQKIEGEVAASLSSAHQSATWSAISLILGAVTVEVFGHMPPCDAATAEALYRDKVRIAQCLIGLPAAAS